MMRALPNSKSLWHKVIVDAQKLSIGGYLLIGSLLAIMAGGFLFIYLAWYLGQETYIPAFGYAAMAGGVVFSLALGFGLMALCFWSSRFGYDEPIKVDRSESHDHVLADKQE